LFTVNGILFNHESPRRSSHFVTKKICFHVAAIKKGCVEFVELGNLDAKRDWGHAKDYVRAMWLMLQQNIPDDYVIATGITRSVRELVVEAFKCVDITILWVGTGVNEVGIDFSGVIRVKCSKALFRPSEVDHLEGDFKKSKTILKWQPEISFEEMIKEMVNHELQQYE